MPSNNNIEVIETAKSITNLGSLLILSSYRTRVLSYKIQYFLRAKASSINTNPDNTGPGDRHNNDFVNYRKTAIFPTADEFISDT